jgi:hypothetical protein
MAFAVIDSVSATTADNNTVTTAAIDSTGANLIVLVVSGTTGVTDYTVSDSKSNTYTALTRYVGAPSVDVRMHYVAAPTVGSGHTFTVTKNSGGSMFPSVAVLAVSGAHATPHDQENGNNAASAAAVSTGNVTPSQDNELIVAGCSYTGPNPSTVTGGSLVEDEDIVEGAGYGVTIAHEIQTTATTVSATFTVGGARELAAAIETFKVAAGAATTPNPHLTELVRPFNMTVSRGRM